MRHRVRHRAVPERADEPVLSVHREVARGPDRRQADVAGEYRIVVCQLAQREGHLLGVDQLPSGACVREIVEVLARFAIVTPRVVEMRDVGLLVEAGPEPVGRGPALPPAAPPERGAGGPGFWPG